MCRGEDPSEQKDAGVMDRRGLDSGDWSVLPQKPRKRRGTHALSAQEACVTRSPSRFAELTGFMASACEKEKQKLERNRRVSCPQHHPGLRGEQSLPTIALYPEPAAALCAHAAFDGNGLGLRRWAGQRV